MALASPSTAEPLIKSDATRARILDASARLFRERGYSAVTLRDIAAEAGMQAGSVYYHFDSKTSIVLEVLDIGIAAVHEKVVQTLDALPPGSSGAEILRASILTHLRTLFEFNDYSSANVRIYHEVPPAIRKANAKARRRYDRLWTQILTREDVRDVLRPDVEPNQFRLLLISSLNATLDWFDGKPSKITALADSYSNMLLNGVLREREEQE